jgi:hypothetical protein
MTAFPELKSVGALAAVEASASDDENAVRYQWNGSAWARTAALTAGYAWTLSSIRDFSAIGLQDGDFGVFTPSGGQPILLRYKAACTTAYGSPMQAWMTPIAYAGTPVMQAWTDGTESNVTLAAQGWTITNDAGCTVTATGGYQRAAATSTGTPVAARLIANSGGITAATRVECLCEARSSVNSPNTLLWLMLLNDGTNATFAGQYENNGFGFLNATSAPVNNPLRNGVSPSLPTLAQNPAVMIIRDEGRTVQSSAYRDGLLIGTYRRNLVANGGNSLMLYQLANVGASASTDFRGQFVTY